MKLERKESKPKFWEWILFDNKAFRVIFFMSLIMGFLVSSLLIWASIYFDWRLEITLIFCVLGGLNIWTAVKTMKNINHIDMSINDFVYSSKYVSNNTKGGKK